MLAQEFNMKQQEYVSHLPWACHSVVASRLALLPDALVSFSVTRRTTVLVTDCLLRGSPRREDGPPHARLEKHPRRSGPPERNGQRDDRSVEAVSFQPSAMSRTVGPVAAAI